MELELPGEQVLERGQRRRGRRRARVGAEERDPGRPRVEAVGVGADDALARPAVTTHVDRPEAVDEEVVADVVPAETARVVDVDPTHDARRFFPCIGVGAGGMVDDGHPHRRRLRRARAQRFVGVPARSRDPGRGIDRGRR